VNKFARIFVFCFVLLFVFAPVAVLAQDNTEVSGGTAASFSLTKTSLGYLGVGIGAGLAVIGGSIGIGLIGSRVIEASARQPEMLGQLRTLMFITAALVEGLALFALVICILCLFVG
jgi:F-type H+-transporting ATPase subunit c